MTETRILLTRHEAHENNLLTKEGAARARERGAKLKETHAIDAVVSSPLPRAVATALEMLRGYGSANVQIFTDLRLGDLGSDKLMPANAMDVLKAKAMEIAGVVNDRTLAMAMIAMEEFHPHVLRRAQEGATAIFEAARKYQGQTVLMPSHGVFRAEIAIGWLSAGRDFRGVTIDLPEHIMGNGEVIEIIFDGDVEFPCAINRLID